MTYLTLGVDLSKDRVNARLKCPLFLQRPDDQSVLAPWSKEYATGGSFHFRSIEDEQRRL